MIAERRASRRPPASRPEAGSRALPTLWAMPTTDADAKGEPGFDGGHRPAGTDRGLVTVPNLLSLGRLACVPIFLWLLFGRDSQVGAAVLLAGLGATDWVDGWVARRFDQVSEVGKVLDPTADRILLGVGAVAIYVEGAVPGVIFWPVVVREVLVSVAVVVLAAARAQRIDVLWAGKAGAFALMFAFPAFLLAEAGTAERLVEAFAWFCAVPGIVLGYVAAVEYARLVPGALRTRTGALGEGAI